MGKKNILYVARKSYCINCSNKETCKYNSTLKCKILKEYIYIFKKLCEENDVKLGLKRKCKACGRYKPISDFNKRRVICKECETNENNKYVKRLRKQSIITKRQYNDASKQYVLKKYIKRTEESIQKWEEKLQETKEKAEKEGNMKSPTYAIRLLHIESKIKSLNERIQVSRELLIELQQNKAQ